MTSHYQILDKHTIVDMFCSKWTPHHNSHLRLCLWCEIVLRNPFSQTKSKLYTKALNTTHIFLSMNLQNIVFLYI